MAPSQTDIASMIRLRPGMYIGDAGPQGIAHLIHELVANGLDQYLAGKATRVEVSHDESRISISDDGEGLPFDIPGTAGRSLAETYFTELHATPTADGHSPHIHLNSGGLGLVVITALSSLVEVVSHRSGLRWTQSFSRGKNLGILQQSPSTGRGTCITFTPDLDAFSSPMPDWPSVRRRLFDTAHLFPGLRLALQEEAFHAPRGLLDYVAFEAAGTADTFGSQNQPVFSMNVDLNDIHINAAAYGSAKSCKWRSWCNGITTTQHGTHVAGFKDALKTAGRKPAAAMIHVLLKQPAFNSPTRSSLTTKHVRAVVRRAVREQLMLDAHHKTHPLL